MDADFDVVVDLDFDPRPTGGARRHTACSSRFSARLHELDHPEFASHDLSCLRTGIMAGAPCPIEVMKRVVSEMSMREVTIAYGMTETSPVSFQSGGDDPLERRVSSVGRIHPHVYLYRHPKIAAVQVFGVPDHKYGEQVCAWIQLRAGDTCSVQEIVDFCRGQIAHYKVPHYVRFVDDFPMTVSGKPQKFIMRQRMMLELKLKEESAA